MKIINYILKAFKWLKEMFDIVKWVIAAIALISTLGWVKSCNNKNKEVARITNVLTSKVETFKTKSGLNAVKADRWEIKYKTLEKYAGEINTENSDLKNEVLEAKETIKEFEIREKDVQNYIKMELVSKDSVETNIIFDSEPCYFKLEPIEKEFLTLRFEQNINYVLMDIDYESRNIIHTLLNLYPSRIDKPKRKRYGKKHFPNWAVLWGYDHTVMTKAKDPKSEITNIVSIEFSK